MRLLADPEALAKSQESRRQEYEQQKAREEAAPALREARLARQRKYMREVYRQ